MKFSKLLTLCVVVALLATFGASAVFAQAAMSNPGDGPGTAVTPTSGNVTIGPGQWQWYTFRSQAPTRPEENTTDTATNRNDAIIDAVLNSPSSAVDFQVWSTDDLNNWRNAADFGPTGSGTKNEFLPGEPLSWQGAFQLNNNYYLIVRNHSSQPATYSLNVTGDVAFPSKLALNGTTPSMPAAVAQTQQPVMSTGEMGLTVAKPAESTLTNSAMTTKIGNDPGTAVTPASGNVMIGPGQWQWYRFRSQAPTRPEENTTDTATNRNDAIIDAVLHSPSSAVDFQVWSKDDLNNWRDGTEFGPTGSGTKNEFLPGEPLSWQGAFQLNNDYYLIVRNHSSQPATYSLNVTGDVAFPASAK